MSGCVCAVLCGCSPGYIHSLDVIASLAMGTLKLFPEHVHPLCDCFSGYTHAQMCINLPGYLSITALSFRPQQLQPSQQSP